LHTYSDEFVAGEFSEKDESDGFVEDGVLYGEIGYNERINEQSKVLLNSIEQILLEDESASGLVQLDQK
jgi:hypothetical protein